MTLNALPFVLWLAALQAGAGQIDDTFATTPPIVEAAPVRAPNLADPVLAPDGPLTPADVSYQNRILSNFQQAQGRLGPLDGRWTVTGPAGDLYALQLNDPGAGESRMEGAWRDLRRGRIGLVESISREGDAVVLRFVEDDAHHPVEVRLRAAMGRGWVGEAVTPDAGSLAIVMQRAPGIELAASQAPYVAPPPRPPKAKAKPRRAPKRAKAKKRR